MGMSKRNFIALAETIRAHNRKGDDVNPFRDDHIDVLADFCQGQNPAFQRRRWVDYIQGRCGPSGGTMHAKQRTPKQRTQ